MKCGWVPAEDYASALRIDEQRRKGGGRSARSGEADDAAATLIKAVYRPASGGEQVTPAMSRHITRQMCQDQGDNLAV